MRAALVLVLTVLVSCWPSAAETPESQVRAVITAFADGMRDRNVAHVQKTVASDVVAILEGVPSDGWEEFRDRRLIPDFAHPAPPSQWSIAKINASADMAWASLRTTISLRTKSEVVWTVLVLERRGKDWKIVLVDRNPGRRPAAPAAKRRR